MIGVKFFKIAMFGLTFMFTAFYWLVPEPLYNLLGFYPSILGDILISPVLPFLVSYFVGKRIVLKYGLSSVILPLLLGNVICSSFLFFYLSLSYYVQLTPDLGIILLRFIEYLSYCLQIFFISFTGIAVGVIRKVGK